jgi:hypothetical protein
MVWGTNAMSVQQAELPEIVEWRAKLDALYANIRAWLARMNPVPTVETVSTRIIEKKSGEYEVPSLIVRRGEGEFRVRPVARWVVGADGRVDLEGGDGPFILVWMREEKAAVYNEDTFMLDEKDIDDWFWVQDRPPWKRVTLTGELFRGLAEVCLE